MRRITGKKIDKKNAASANTMGRFETRMLSVKDNSKPFRKSMANGWNEHWRRPLIDESFWIMDSSASPVHGEQEDSAYNGHFGCTCYHPLFCFNQFGDCEGAMLRPGNVHSADRWNELLEPIVARYEKKKVRKYFRGDAAFAKPEIFQNLEKKDFLYAIRLPANQVLQEKIEHLLTRPVGRPPRKPVVWFADFSYQAASWDRPRRVIAKVEWHRCELFSESRFHRDQYERASSRGGSFLQWAWHRRAVDQGRQVCVELDTTLLPALCPESGEVGSVRFGL